MRIRAALSTLMGQRPIAQSLMDARERLPWSKLPWSPLTVLTYHHVEQPDADYRFDPDVADATTDMFDSQMAWVAANFSVVRLADLARAARGEGALPANALLITFDDGYKSCLTRALPVLARHQLPATFFVPTGYIDDRRLFWWEQIAWMLRERQGTAFAMTYPTARRFIANETGRHALLRLVKDSANLDLPRFMRELAAALQIDWTPELERRLADELIMTWDDLRALRDAGMDIASHGVTHRVLQQIALGEVATELRHSKRRLEEELGRPTLAIAYPTGRSVASDRTLHQAVRDAGYTLGFANANGMSLRRRRDWLDLPRYALDRQLSLDEFRGQLAVPWLSYRAQLAPAGAGLPPPGSTPTAAPNHPDAPPEASTLRAALREQWIRRTMKGIARRDAHKRIDFAYRVADPWHMASAKEQFRFAATNKILREQFGDIDTLLELGCGEGHQTEHLAQLARQVTGLDISATAIARAQARVPGAAFETGLVTDERWEGGRFDVVVACEVLYYIKDLAATLARLDALATRGWLITYFDGAERVLADDLARFAATRQPVQRNTFRYQDVTWNVMWHVKR
ncbi:MAG: polysaccharide deacetylase family protein [Myxococcales bacterium]|nr:polysaccharide deacetylase family protein [Myxococcales bacterium]